MNIPNLSQANDYPTRFKPVNSNLTLDLAHPCHPHFPSNSSREKDKTFRLLFLLKKYQSFKKSAQKGFTLLELLITVLIEATNGYNSAYKQAGMYQVSNGDDWVLSLGLAPCN